MTRVVYNTATTLDGYLADPDDSLEWLFAVPGSAEAESSFPAFLEGIGALVMGSTTYEWVYNHERLDEHPEKWAYGDRLSLVLTTRDLPLVEGANIRLHSGSVREAWEQLVSAADGRDVWVVGGGDVVGQFADAGLLDEIRVSIAPVTLGAGKPLLPRRLESDRLVLESARQSGQFAELVYSVRSSS
ncbi:dihydrofolate reductase [Microbacterium sp. 4R-513]|uniref:dihydrofolate reductase family protein n=1 Tax=Microbacterium sp. 4R-513 TaxID=2567934 RepID=UPI0013E1C666|nr:dihydrofolate reductase family protein [Microbacterium sp. 4R-513]QIG40744.1 dihydrofolate reductase [Microbacterium sp. 4R-513]